MRPLPLRELHLQRGALLGERDGAEVALGYGDTFAEYRAARSSVALLDRSDRTLLRVTGEDRATWLHGMTTNDVKGLAVGAGQRTTLCTAKGKAIGLGVLNKREADILVDLDPLCHDGVVPTLERFLISEDAELLDETGQHALLSLVGPGAAALVQELLQLGALPEERWASITAHYAGREVWVRRGRLGDLPALDLWAPGPELFELFSARAPMLGHQAAELLRIEGGEPRYGREVTDATIPQEAGLDSAISYHKGCYIGQETIARLHFRGHVNKLLRGFALADGSQAPAPGAAITVQGEDKGKVTSACLSPSQGRVIALGYIRREFAEPGQTVQLATEAGTVEGVVYALPNDAA